MSYEVEITQHAERVFYGRLHETTLGICGPEVVRTTGKHGPFSDETRVIQWAENMREAWERASKFPRQWTVKL